MNITEDTNKDHSLCRNVPKDTRESKTVSAPYGHGVISRTRYERPKDTRYQRYRRAMVRILSLCFQRTKFQRYQKVLDIKDINTDRKIYDALEYQRYSMATYRRYQTISVSKILMSNDSYTEP